MSTEHPPAAAAPVAPPVCPRHPDRISYVSCQRCGRPACPECQVPAAVGFQCVDCVREQKKSGPRVRNTFGGQVKARSMTVTWTLIGICVAVYALQWLVPDNWIFQHFAYANAFAGTEPWRMLTAGFLHSQGFVLHLLMNMYALWVLGQALEPLLGRVRFLAIYLISLLGGSVGYLLLTPVLENGQIVGVVGASGAIFGLFGAMLVVQRRRGGPINQLVILLVVNAVLGFTISGIAWQAHLGGFIAGLLSAALILGTQKAKARVPLQIAGFAALLLVMVALSWMRISLLGIPTA